MNKTRYIIRFNRKNKTDKQGFAPIQIECYLNGKRKFFDTKIKVKPKDWNDKTQSIKPTHPNAINLNKNIAEFIRNLEAYELERINNGKPFALSMLDNLFGAKKISTFNEFMAVEIENSNLTTRTKQAHLTTLNRLNEFKKNISFDMINFELMHDFEAFCNKIRITEKGTEKPLKHNTIWKYFKNIKTYVNLAINKEYLTLEQYPFRKFKFTAVETEKAYLTPYEIEEIESLVLDETDPLYYVKDLFLFSVYTGLRYSDVFSLEKKHIVTMEGKRWIIKNMEKTKEKVRIPIHALFNGKPYEIILKYWDLGRSECFRPLTNQYINRQLKELISLTNIDKNITFHTARHTTATYLLYKGANITTVQKVLGHKDIKTTQIYGHIMDATIENDLKAINF